MQGNCFTQDLTSGFLSIFYVTIHFTKCSVFVYMCPIFMFLYVFIYVCVGMPLEVWLTQGVSVFVLCV